MCWSQYVSCTCAFMSHWRKVAAEPDKSDGKWNPSTSTIDYRSKVVFFLGRAHIEDMCRHVSLRLSLDNFFFIDF